MKKLIASLLLISPLASASQCALESQYVQANYQVNSEQTTNNTLAQAQQFTLWRTPHQVAEQGSELVEVWQQLSNQQIRPIRYFQAHQRGIEYQPSEVQGEQDWSTKYQLVSDDFIAKMTLKSEQGEGCEQLQNYQLVQGDTKIELAWLVNKKLLSSMRISKPQLTQTLTLDKVKFDKAAVMQQFANWDSFQTTDYADIGDNEGDPFLAKMINLGFIEHGASGFYDAGGKALGGGHSH
ncbi:hypothetical protein [Pseudoalteromonas prydzensis]|uniref:hypothetical protein n=1 Tax=Pseudoalteromonas prydzensis TaxID=182141 RepID=UPI0007E5221F|nr:hypothetical protein [Pseudoalteromonas prydzensis]MBE0377507.1 hypothetical protein [Pseudoalteromonas prydzensis ACAM 620]